MIFVFGNCHWATQFYTPIAISFSIIGMCRLVCSAYLANTSQGACSLRKVVLPLNDSLAGSSSSSRPTKHKQLHTHPFQLYAIDWGYNCEGTSKVGGWIDQCQSFNSKFGVYLLRQNIKLESNFSVWLADNSLMILRCIAGNKDAKSQQGTVAAFLHHKIE